MTIEQALRWLTWRGARLRLWLEDGEARVEVRLGGERERAWQKSVSAESLGEKPLSVLSWQLVSLVKEMQRREFMAKVHRRTCELFDMQAPDSHRLTARDLLQFAQIVDEELEQLQKSIGVKREGARHLVDEYGQTETKE